MRGYEDMMTVKEYARMIRISVYTVRRWIARGLLEYTRVGGLIFIDRNTPPPTFRIKKRKTYDRKTSQN